MLSRFLIGLLALSALACSSPTTPVAKHTGWPASPPYTWPDSLPRYFPVEAGVNPNHIQPGDTMRSIPFDRLTDCHYEYEYAASCLAAAKAPVLRTDSAGPVTYRFIWLRSFDQPALLTLTCTPNGEAVLQTDFLNKSPGMTVPTLSGPDTMEFTSEGREHFRKFLRKKQADSAFMKQFRAQVAFAKAPVRVLPARTVQLTAAQVAQFEQQLNRAKFWQLPSCKVSGILDGAYWFLEARTAGRYHVVFRHSPDAGDGFRRCCELLLDWGAAKGEERY